MKRRALLGLAALTTLAPRLVLAAPVKKFRIYMVTWRGTTQVEKGFQDYLAAIKMPVEYIVRDAGQNPQKLNEFAEEILQLKPDLIYTWGTSVTLGLVGPWDKPKPALANIPTVFTLVAAPVGAKIVSSLEAHGRNLTGVYHVAPLETQLDAIRAYRPFKKIGVLYNEAEQNSVAVTREMETLAKAQGFTVVTRTFQRDAAGKPQPDGISDRVRALKDAGAEWLYLGADSYLFTKLGLVAAAALDAKLPTFAATEAVMNDKDAGVLAGLVSKYYSIGQFTAFKASQILAKGMAAQTIPVETLQRRAFIVRMDTAKKLGLLPPVALFNYAEFV